MHSVWTESLLFVGGKVSFAKSRQAQPLFSLCRKVGSVNSVSAEPLLFLQSTFYEIPEFRIENNHCLSNCKMGFAKSRRAQPLLFYSEKLCLWIPYLQNHCFLFCMRSAKSRRAQWLFFSVEKWRLWTPCPKSHRFSDWKSRFCEVPTSTSVSFPLRRVASVNSVCTDSLVFQLEK